MENVAPTDRRPVPYKTRIEKSGKYTPKYPVRPSKRVVNGALKCTKASNTRTYRRGRVRVYGSKEDVFRGRALVTRGGLRIGDLESRRVQGRRMVYKRVWRSNAGRARLYRKRQTPLT